ncbi:uncharacterized protein LOC132638416 isoform X2 [Lycium barbarum]|uniref:uncharacterized protein LOC132638416 isoform X2 n=1 Tax=Lycium barbarum TaxID=112863 RepID=UPI00293EB968|nr:uncharacterized protein LOC132638416 isoform X2 [Lycium barbarum]
MILNGRAIWICIVEERSRRTYEFFQNFDEVEYISKLTFIHQRNTRMQGERRIWISHWLQIITKATTGLHYSHIYALEERYQEVLREKSQSQSDIDQCEAYYEAAGGTRKRRIYGLGSQAQNYALTILDGCVGSFGS